MNKIEYLLTVLTEESAEIGQESCKAVRFGLDDVKPGQPDDNRRRLEREIAQLLGVARMLGLKIRESDIIGKIAKVKKYMVYSVERGTLRGTTAGEFRNGAKAPKSVVMALRKAREIRGR